MTVADRIKDRRLDLNLTQEELADKAGYCAKTAISRIEHSGNDISMKQVKRLSVALECSMAYLMGWESAEEEPQKEIIEVTPSGYINSSDLPKAVELFERYQNAPQYIQDAIENLLKSSQSDKQ